MFAPQVLELHHCCRRFLQDASFVVLRKQHETTTEDLNRNFKDLDCSVESARGFSQCLELVIAGIVKLVPQEALGNRLAFLWSSDVKRTKNMQK